MFTFPNFYPCVVFAIKPDTARHIEKSIVFPLATTEHG